MEKVKFIAKKFFEMDTLPDTDQQYLKTDPDPLSDANPTGSGSTALIGSFPSIVNYWYTLQLYR
jgi:hypothetical protein